MEKERFGIISFGNMGSSHTKCLTTGEVNCAESTATFDGGIHVLSEKPLGVFTKRVIRPYRSCKEDVFQAVFLFSQMFEKKFKKG